MEFHGRCAAVRMGLVQRGNAKIALYRTVPIAGEDQYHAGSQDVGELLLGHMQRPCPIGAHDWRAIMSSIVVPLRLV